MSQQQSATASLPKDLPILAVLGLTDPGEGDWARLRGLQYSCLPRAMLSRLCAQGLAGLATASLLLGHINPLVIILWLMALGGSLYYGTKIDHSLVDADRRRMSSEEVNRQTTSAIINALVWVIPIAVTTLFADPETQLKLWTVLAMLMTASAKVDRSFVQGAATGNPESLAIIRAVVAMADSLEMSTTAEGVETEAELKVVRDLGCRKVQGYFFGRPMPAEDAAALFRKWDAIRSDSAA